MKEAPSRLMEEVLIGPKGRLFRVSPLPRRGLRGGAHRARHGQHRAAGHRRSLPRSRAGAPQPDGGRRAGTGHAGRINGAGISLEEVTARLLEEGLKLFVVPFDKLLQAVEKVRLAALGAGGTRHRATLPAPLASALRAATDEWQAGGKMERLWGRDAKLWTGRDEASWLGWLDVTHGRRPRVDAVRALAAEVQARGDTDVLLLGMGGSSLCPEVLAETFGRQPGFPRFHVLDSTDPARIRAVEAKLDLARTLLIVASKSGSTLEPNIFLQYFFDRLERAVGRGGAQGRG